MGTEKRLKKKWDKGVDWDELLPPSRPSIYHLQMIKEQLGKMDRSCPIAILGSTPEFRDLIASLGFRSVFVFDHSVEFHDRANRLRCYSNKETLVVGDWLNTLKHHPRKFISILSDLTSGNVPYDKQVEFYATISQALSKEGLFIDKVLTNEAKFLSLDELDEKYKGLPYNLQTLNFFSCQYFFCSELVESHGLTDVDTFYDILNKRFSHPVLRKFLENTLRMTPKGGIWYYGDSWYNFQERYFQHLKLKKSFLEPPESPYHNRMKILVSESLLIE